MDAEVLKYSDVDDGHDLALLRIRKFNFVKDTVTFHLGDEIPNLGDDLLHVGSLLGQMGAKQHDRWNLLSAWQTYQKLE